MRTDARICATYLAFSLVFGLTCATSADANVPRREARVPGGVALVRVADASAPAPTVTHEGKRVWVARHRVAKQSEGWYAVVGIPLSTKPGEQTLTVNANGAERAQTFRVAGKQYPVQKLTFTDKGMVEPSTENTQRIEREAKHLGEVRRTFTPSETTDGAFIQPAEGRLSSRFGLQRVLNGKPRSPHAGLDIAIPTGTPVHAASDAVVRDTGDYYFLGKTVYLDHGNGMLTLYAHLSEISVKAGDVVRKGAPIGLSGMTGRATGPHLHWSVVLNGVMVEPELFLPASAAR
jgi:murein DD-endopeptidase MepM/ murein hydrolase activator NlpD